MMKMNGKTNNITDLYKRQLKIQEKILNKDAYYCFIKREIEHLPFDEPILASYHIQQLMSEIGEVLEADKRWKSFRNEKYDRTNKLEELADCFIVLMNVAIFSGFESKELYDAINKKMDKILERVDKL